MQILLVVEKENVKRAIFLLFIFQSLVIDKKTVYVAIIFVICDLKFNVYYGIFRL